VPTCSLQNTDSLLNASIEEVRSFSSVATFYTSAVEVFSRWFRADIHGFGAANFRTGEAKGSLVGVDGGKWTEVYYQHCASHPAYRAALKMGSHWAIRTTDIVPYEIFQQCDLYKYFFVPLGVDYDIAANCLCTEAEHISLIAWRAEENFSEDELDSLKVFAREVGRSFEAAMKTTTLQLDHTTARTSLMEYGLTPRERDVLFWIAQGKTNSEIGIVLGLSSHTVHKHVDRILFKLGVETRTAAACVALKLMESKPA
jgi:DNA-binding CsgD family transcriptional regulator